MLYDYIHKGDKLFTYMIMYDGYLVMVYTTSGKKPREFVAKLLRHNIIRRQCS